MHDKNLGHRDIDPKNIMFKDGVVKIVDFGFSTILSRKSQLVISRVGKPLYIAPEIMRDEDYSA